MGNKTSKSNSGSHDKKMNRASKRDSDCGILGSSSLKGGSDSSDEMVKGVSKSESDGNDKMSKSALKSDSDIDKMDSNCMDKKIASMSESDSEMDSAMKRDESPRYYNNGVKFVEKVKRSESGSKLSPKSENVIGLDFGTSTIAVCYVTSASDKLYKFKIQDEDADYSTPTVLLIDQDNKIEIGSRALRRYIRLEVDVNNSIYFDKVKLKLQHNKVNILNNQNLV